jgi:hypothetical protein
VVLAEGGIDPPCLPAPLGVVGHRENEAKVGELPVELLELLEERRGLTVAVRVDQGDAVRELLLADVEEHAAKHGDPDAARDEDERS